MPMPRVRFVSSARLFEFAACGAVAAAVAGCAETRGGSIPYGVSDFGAPDAPTVESLESSYRIAPMDTLAIKVFGMADLTGDYQVDLRGNISMPLIGEVSVLNLTPAELDEALTRRYSEKYLENPDVSVGVKESAGRVVTVDGAVSKGGMYPVLGQISLMQAIALAGGVDQTTANPRRVAIFRTIDGKRQAAAFDLISIRRGEMEDPQVFSGDIIIVDGSKIKEAQQMFFRTVPLFNIFRPF
jgi:polysaccharide export outer membrane protein